MYSVKVTHTRPSVDVPFYWETNLADHETYLTTLKNYYGANITLVDRVYAEDSLSVNNIMTAESIEEFANTRAAANNDINLIKYWLARDEYNHNNNISKVLIEI
jgi:hypothetical protein